MYRSAWVRAAAVSHLHGSAGKLQASRAPALVSARSARGIDSSIASPSSWIVPARFRHFSTAGSGADGSEPDSKVDGTDTSSVPQEIESTSRAEDVLEAQSSHAPAAAAASMQPSDDAAEEAEDLEEKEEEEEEGGQEQEEEEEMPASLSGPMDMPPAPWRHAREWVDLELERAGIPSEGGAAVALDSPWGSEEFQPPDINVLWPHTALNDHRSRPFVLPRHVPNEDLKEKEKQLAANRERLAALWHYSASHGISWDELDHAYVNFAKTGNKRYAEWSRGTEYKLPKAALQRKAASARAARYLVRFVPKDPEGKISDPAVMYPSRTRRLAARIYVEDKKKFLSPWGPGRLTVKLQQLVAAKMLRRETQERAHGFQRGGDQAGKVA